MKKALAFSGLFVLFFTSNIRGVVEGSLLQPTLIMPQMINTLNTPQIDQQLPAITSLERQSGKILSEIEYLRWIDIFA